MVHAKFGLFAKRVSAQSDIVNLEINDYCILEHTSLDLEFARVNALNVQDVEVEYRLVRKATEADWQHFRMLHKTINEKADACSELIQQYQLPVKLIGIDHSFDGGRFVFYFLNKKANSLNLRILVKDLGLRYKTKIQLKQVGDREAAKIFPLYGMCGQQTCCSRFLEDAKPIARHVAQEQLFCSCAQSMCGCCGKVKCCFNYECEGIETQSSCLGR